MNRTVYPTLFQARRASDHRQAICANYAQYEERKAAWRMANPDATHVEYDCAMQRIARECGV
jgi:hypothetical protein